MVRLFTIQLECLMMEDSFLGVRLHMSVIRDTKKPGTQHLFVFEMICLEDHHIVVEVLELSY